MPRKRTPRLKKPRNNKTRRKPLKNKTIRKTKRLNRDKRKTKRNSFYKIRGGAKKEDDIEKILGKDCGSLWRLEYGAIKSGLVSGIKTTQDHDDHIKKGKIMEWVFDHKRLFFDTLRTRIFRSFDFSDNFGDTSPQDAPLRISFFKDPDDPVVTESELEKMTITYANKADLDTKIDTAKVGGGGVLYYIPKSMKNKIVEKLFNLKKVESQFISRGIEVLKVLLPKHRVKVKVDNILLEDVLKLLYGNTPHREACSSSDEFKSILKTLVDNYNKYHLHVANTRLEEEEDAAAAAAAAEKTQDDDAAAAEKTQDDDDDDDDEIGLGAMIGLEGDDY
tara:strand:+ start:789 stop:1790 length:1002 start_codon:yes stop_codon:yes gene_type:complete